MNEKKVVEIKNLTKNYSAGGFLTSVLKGINLEIKKNDFIAVMGPSGSGKTTLLNILSILQDFQTKNYQNLGEIKSVLFFRTIIFWIR